MPFIEQAVADAKEDQVVPEAEYDLEVLSYSMEISKAAKAEGASEPNMIHIVIAIRSEEHENARPINYYMMLTNAEDPYRAMRLRDQKRFLECFSVAYEGNGFDPDDFVGAKGHALVGVEANPKGGENNVLRLPQFVEAEEGEGEARTPARGGRTRPAPAPARGKAAGGRSRR